MHLRFERGGVGEVFVVVGVIVVGVQVLGWQLRQTTRPATFLGLRVAFVRLHR